MHQPLPSRRAEIADLYTKYGATVLGRCRYLLHDGEAAKDATQEVFVKVMRSLDTFRSEASPVTWILKIATNHCLNVIASNRAKWRDTVKRQAELEEELAAQGESSLERARMVRGLLDKLDEETQAVAIHYWVDEMTQEEIGALLGRSLPTIRKRLEKFRRVAARELSDEG